MKNLKKTPLRVLAATVIGVMIAGTAAVTASASSDYIFSATNSYRSSNGASALKSNSGAASVATAWSQKMLKEGRLYHNPNYSSQIPGGWSAAAENVGYACGYGGQQKNAEVVMNGWKNSAGHRKNMLTKSFTDIGVGIAYDAGTDCLYATQNFMEYTPKETETPKPKPTETSTPKPKPTETSKPKETSTPKSTESSKPKSTSTPSKTSTPKSTESSKGDTSSPSNSSTPKSTESSKGDTSTPKNEDSASPEDKVTIKAEPSAIPTAIAEVIAEDTGLDVEEVKKGNVVSELEAGTYYLLTSTLDENGAGTRMFAYITNDGEIVQFFTAPRTWMIPV